MIALKIDFFSPSKLIKGYEEKSNNQFLTLTKFALSTNNLLRILLYRYL